jgi:hypothetical protein
MAAAAGDTGVAAVERKVRRVDPERQPWLLLGTT